MKEEPLAANGSESLVRGKTEIFVSKHALSCECPLQNPSRPPEMQQGWWGPSWTRPVWQHGDGSSHTVLALQLGVCVYQAWVCCVGQAHPAPARAGVWGPDGVRRE